MLMSSPTATASDSGLAVTASFCFWGATRWGVCACVSVRPFLCDHQLRTVDQQFRAVIYYVRCSFLGRFFSFKCDFSFSFPCYLPGIIPRSRHIRASSSFSCDHDFRVMIAVACISIFSATTIFCSIFLSVQLLLLFVRFLFFLFFIIIYPPADGGNKKLVCVFCLIIISVRPAEDQHPAIIVLVRSVNNPRATIILERCGRFRFVSVINILRIYCHAFINFVRVSFPTHPPPPPFTT